MQQDENKSWNGKISSITFIMFTRNGKICLGNGSKTPYMLLQGLFRDDRSLQRQICSKREKGGLTMGKLVFFTLWFGY